MPGFPGQDGATLNRTRPRTSNYVMPLDWFLFSGIVVFKHRGDDVKRLTVLSLIGLLLFFPVHFAFCAEKDDSKQEKSSEKKEAGEESPPPFNPFDTTWKPPEDARTGTIFFSNGKKVSGLIYSTRNKPFRMFDQKLKKSVDVWVPDILTIEAKVEEELMEAEWRWVEAASDEKVFTGKYYPRRKYRTIITLRKKDKYGKPIEFVGHINALIYLLEKKKKRPEKYELHIRQKGELDEKLEDLVYIKKIDFSAAGEKNTEAQKQEPPSESADESSDEE